MYDNRLALLQRSERRTAACSTTLIACTGFLPPRSVRRAFCQLVVPAPTCLAVSRGDLGCRAAATQWRPRHLSIHANKLYTALVAEKPEHGTVALMAHYLRWPNVVTCMANGLHAHQSLGLQVARPEEGDRDADNRNPGADVVTGVGPVPVDRPVKNSAPRWNYGCNIKMSTIRCTGLTGTEMAS